MYKGWCEKAVQIISQCYRFVTSLENIVNCFHAALHVHVQPHQNMMCSLYLPARLAWVMFETPLSLELCISCISKKVDSA